MLGCIKCFFSEHRLPLTNSRGLRETTGGRMDGPGVRGVPVLRMR